MPLRVQRPALRWLAAGVVVAAAAVTAVALRHDDVPAPAASGEAPTVRADAAGTGEPSASEVGSARPAPLEAAPRRIGGYTEAEHQAFKESYYCDLGRAAREACATAGGGAEAYDQCLALQSYHTYSRHCGYQP
jgi:hypothetical protein